MLRLGRSLCQTAAIVTRSSRGTAVASFHATPIAQFGLEAFRDSVPRQQRMTERVGRSWSVRELRRKSYDE